MKQAAFGLLCFIILIHSVHIEHKLNQLEKYNEQGIYLYSQMLQDNLSRQEQIEKIVTATAIRESRLAVQDYLSKPK
ncbi:hypothetical protein [Pseudomonas sp. PSE14]|uniref:hypothetical protein n=1 Tax=Pseudomonas sp. PSE14 TaxID=3016341 RepID=UPI0023D7F6CB|nr:hypothetical protein [Pseudomonas sp. PSE14]WEJ70447.1 hypothetical protein O6P39_17420 [Pseudomonas sp. PSE14]